MGKINSEELIDIFKEEVTRKEKKEKKKKKREEKKLEKLEDLEFKKLAESKEEIKETPKVVEEKIPEPKVIKQETLQDTMALKRQEKHKKNYSSLTVISFLFDTIFGFFLILLLLMGGVFVGYMLCHSLTKETIFKVITLGGFTIFYIFSMIIKKEGLKKFCALVSSILISLFMAYTLYIM